jgi:hypothetical protein
VDSTASQALSMGDQLLLDVERGIGSSSKFVNKGGEFHDWWRGGKSFVEQARRQSDVAGEHSIKVIHAPYLDENRL